MGLFKRGGFFGSSDNVLIKGNPGYDKRVYQPDLIEGNELNSIENKPKQALTLAEKVTHPLNPDNFPYESTILPVITRKFEGLRLDIVMQAFYMQFVVLNPTGVIIDFSTGFVAGADNSGNITYVSANKMFVSPPFPFSELHGLMRAAIVGNTGLPTVYCYPCKDYNYMQPGVYSL